MTYNHHYKMKKKQKKEFNFNSLFSKVNKSSIGHKIISTDNYINILTLNHLTIHLMNLLILIQIFVFLFQDTFLKIIYWEIYCKM